MSREICFISCAYTIKKLPAILTYRIVITHNTKGNCKRRLFKCILIVVSASRKIFSQREIFVDHYFSTLGVVQPPTHNAFRFRGLMSWVFKKNSVESSSTNYITSCQWEQNNLQAESPEGSRPAFESIKWFLSVQCIEQNNRDGAT